MRERERAGRRGDEENGIIYRPSAENNTSMFYLYRYPFFNQITEADLYLYDAQRFQKLFTACFTKISPQSLEQI